MTGRVRAALPTDARAVAEVHVDGWRSGYRGLVPQDHLDALSVDEREERWRVTAEQGHGLLVLDVDDRVDGFCAFGPGADDDVPAAAGAVGSLYVRHAAWGRGGGGRLLDAAVEVLRRDAAARAEGQPPLLWALEGNVRARAFYERRGWRVDGRRRTSRRPGAGGTPGICFDEVRYRLRA